MKRLFAAIIIAMAFTLESGAAFKDAGWGVRPLGMGGAFTAVANDANASLYNPAGTAQLQSAEGTFMSSRLFTGLDGVDVGMNYLSYVQPFDRRHGSVGLTWSSLFSPALYREDAVTVSYGRFITDLVDETFGGISASGLETAAGVNLKYLRHEFSLDERTRGSVDPVFSGGNDAAALTADIGILAALPDTGISFALAAKNISRPDIGLADPDAVPNETVLGVAFTRETMPFINLPYCTLALDLAERNRRYDARFGIETWLMDGSFAVRGGARSDELTLGLGYELPAGKSGVKLVIDYAFAVPLAIEKTSGSHRMGLTLRLP